MNDTKRKLIIQAGTAKDAVRKECYPLGDSDRVVAICSISGVAKEIPFRSYRANWRHPVVRDWLAKAREADRELDSSIAPQLIDALKGEFYGVYDNLTTSADMMVGADHLDDWLKGRYNALYAEASGEFN